nr:phosphotransferase [Nocardioides faecalis]
MLPSRIPHGRTARRLEWVHLPPRLRRQVEERLGSPVEVAESAGGGFSPGFASVLTCADGTKHFVKAASTIAQRAFAESYRDEAARLSVLPASTPTPPLLWSADGGEHAEWGDWVVLETAYVEARAPQRPWIEEDLDAAETLALRLAEVLTPAPGDGSGGGSGDGSGAAPTPAAEEMAAWPGLWRRLDHPHAVEAAALARRLPEVVVGDTLCHTEIRDDNILITPGGTALVCDWNWPVAGPAWLDSLLLLIGPRGDGLDVEARIARHPLLADVPPEDIDVALALVLGWFSTCAAQPVPSSSPYVRAAQAWQRDVVDDWLGERRGWR